MTTADTDWLAPGAKVAVYVAMVYDRHADPEPHVFSTPEAAIEFARNTAYNKARSPADVREEDVDEWLYHAAYSWEGDSVWVLKKKIDNPGGGEDERR